MTASDFCDLCELPLATCVHGQPPKPAPAPAPVRPAAPRRSAAPRSARTTRAAAPVESGPPRLRRGQALTNGSRKRTPQAEFKPYIVELLQQAGGEQHVDDLLAELEARMEPILLPEDYETLPPQHEARWRYNARWARKALVDDGLVLPPGRPGIWELTPAGRAITVE